MVYEKTTAELALDILRNKPGSTPRGDKVEMRRQIAPAGAISSGWRIVWAEVCERGRYLSIRTGWNGVLFDIDQRDHWDRPQAMADEVENRLSRLARMAGHEPQGFQLELI